MCINDISFFYWNSTCNICNKIIMKQPKQKNCIECGKLFNQYNSLVKVCSTECAIKNAKAKTKKEVVKKWQTEKKAIKEKLMTLSEWKKLLEPEINHIARLIDKDTGCISCGGHTTPNGGHYHSVKSNDSIRFNLDNIHLQDYNCNGKKGANIPMYDLGIIDRYGKEYWEYMKFDIVRLFPLLKLAKFEYKEKIQIARSIVKHLKIENKTYNSIERIELRKKFNKMIGIYE